MRPLPFVLVAALVIFMYFFGVHTASVALLTPSLLVVATLVLAVSYAELPSSWGVTKVCVPAGVVRRTWGVICISTLLALSVPTTHWPLRLSYHLSKSSLNALASGVTTPAHFVSPREAGVFSVYDVQRRGGVVCLSLDEDQGEPLLLVRGTALQVQVQLPDCDVVVLDQNWCLASSL